jgi:hypothetical protein
VEAQKVFQHAGALRELEEEAKRLEHRARAAPLSSSLERAVTLQSLNGLLSMEINERIGEVTADMLLDMDAETFAGLSHSAFANLYFRFPTAMEAVMEWHGKAGIDPLAEREALLDILPMLLPEPGQPNPDKFVSDAEARQLVEAAQSFQAFLQSDELQEGSPFEILRQDVQKFLGAMDSAVLEQEKVCVRIALRRHLLAEANPIDGGAWERVNAQLDEIFSQMGKDSQLPAEHAHILIERVGAMLEEQLPDRPQMRERVAQSLEIVLRPGRRTDQAELRERGLVEAKEQLREVVSERRRAKAIGAWIFFCISCFAFPLLALFAFSSSLRDLLRHPITDVGQAAYIKRQVADAFRSGGQQSPSTQQDARTGAQRETILRQMRARLWLQMMGQHIPRLASAGHQLGGIPQSSLGDSLPIPA